MLTQPHEHSEDIYQTCLPQGKGKTMLPSFPPLGKGSSSPKGICLCRDFNFIFPLSCSAPSPSLPPRVPRANGADELLKSFLRALFPSSHSQRPPVATCHSQGLITCAGLGAAHSSPASPAEMLTSGRWAPASPRPAVRRGRRRGNATHEQRGDGQHRENGTSDGRSVEERVGAAPRCPGAGGAPNAGPDADGSWCCSLDTLLRKKN